MKVKVIDNNIDEDAELELALYSNNVLEQLWLRGNKLNTAILNSLEYLTTFLVLLKIAKVIKNNNAVIRFF